jgi:hypothetical protein
MPHSKLDPRFVGTAKGSNPERERGACTELNRQVAVPNFL